MSKYFGLSDEGNIYYLGECDTLKDANLVADDTGVDIRTLVDEDKAKQWAVFLTSRLLEDDDE